MKVSFLFLLHALVQGQRECGQEGVWMHVYDLPWDCEVMDGSLEGATKASDMKNLKEIRGTLLLKNDLSFERAIKLRMLKMQDFITENSLWFPNVDAKRLEMVNVLGPEVSFGNEPEEFVMLESSIDSITGISGNLLKNLDLTGSSFESFSLDEARVMKDIKVIRVPKVDLKSLLPNLELAESVTISNVGTELVELGLMNVTDRIDVLNNKDLKSINFPSLTYVGNEIRVTKNPLLTGFRATSLEYAKLSIYDELQVLEIPTTLTWSGHSHFNANQFCPTYAKAFQLLKWNNEICPVCENMSFWVTDETIEEIRKCERVGSLVINEDSPSEVNLDNLKSIGGDLKIQNYSGFLSMVSLKTIEGDLLLERIDGLTENFSRHLETVGSLKFSRVFQDFQFSDVQVLDSIFVAHSSMKEVGGIHAIKLNQLLVYNCTMPIKIPLFTLREVGNLDVRMADISYFKTMFSDALVVTNSVEFSESLVTKVDINFMINGSFSLRNNQNLRIVKFNSQTSFEVYQEDNPKLQLIYFRDQTMNVISISLPRDNHTTWKHENKTSANATSFSSDLFRFSDPALQKRLRMFQELVKPSKALYGAIVFAALVGTLLVIFYSK